VHPDIRMNYFDDPHDMAVMVAVLRRTLDVVAHWPQHRTIGPLRILGVPIKLSDTPGAVRTAPPTLGEHTDAVLRKDLGLTPEVIARLREQRVI